MPTSAVSTSIRWPFSLLIVTQRACAVDEGGKHSSANSERRDQTRIVMFGRGVCLTLGSREDDRHAESDTAHALGLLCNLLLDANA